MRPDCPRRVEKTEQGRVLLREGVGILMKLIRVQRARIGRGERERE